MKREIIPGRFILLILAAFLAIMVLPIVLASLSGQLDLPVEPILPAPSPLRYRNKVQLPVGTVLAAGEARLRVTQIGKECHNDCEIRRLVGSCVMPTDGIFAEVIRGGEIRPGDEIHLEVKEK